MEINRRRFLQSVAALGTLTTFGLGMTRTVGKAKAASDKTWATVPSGAQPPEARIDAKTGEVTLNPDILIRHSVCLGCYADCGNRVKIDKRTGKISRVFGNPYHPVSAEPHLPFNASLEESYRAFSTFGNNGHKQRASLCTRGNSTFEAVYDPTRILTPLKRNGKRGEGKWKPITWEDALTETVEGGQLFKDLGDNTVIEGFRQVRDLKTPIDSKRPEMGPKANQLVWIGGHFDGRGAIMTRFTNAFGTVNNYGHGGT